MTEGSETKGLLKDLEDRIQYLEDAYKSHVEELALLSSLGEFQSSIKDCREPAKVLGIARSHIQRLMAFQATAFAMVNPNTFEFEITDCDPAEDRTRIQNLMKHEVEEGTFAWAIRQNHAIIIRKKN